jgi:hypothetical protein
MSATKGVKRRASQPIRLTPILAGRELGVSSRALARKLVSNAILPGEDSMFSMRQIFDALNGNSDLERRAKEARWQSKIDEAELSRLRLEEKQEKLIHVDVILAKIEDYVATFASGVRHSSMPKNEQRQLIDQLTQIACRKLAASGTRESDAIVQRQQRRREAREYAKRMEPIWDEERRQREERKREEDAKWRQKMEKARREREAAGLEWGGTLVRGDDGQITIVRSENGQAQS